MCFSIVAPHASHFASTHPPAPPTKELAEVHGERVFALDLLPGLKSGDSRRELARFRGGSARSGL